MERPGSTGSPPPMTCQPGALEVDEVAQRRGDDGPVRVVHDERQPGPGSLAVGDPVVGADLFAEVHQRQLRRQLPEERLPLGVPVPVLLGDLFGPEDHRAAEGAVDVEDLRFQQGAVNGGVEFEPGNARAEPGEVGERLGGRSPPPPSRSSAPGSHSTGGPGGARSPPPRSRARGGSRAAGTRAESASGFRRARAMAAFTPRTKAGMIRSPRGWYQRISSPMSFRNRWRRVPMSRCSSDGPRISATVPVACRRHISNWKSRFSAAR